MNQGRFHQTFAFRTRKEIRYALKTLKDNGQSCSFIPGTILRVSRDGKESHRKFIEKKELKITLLSDEKAEIHEKYDVMHPKNFRGNEVISTVRTTFLINPR
ncbi:Thiol peroxidase, Bcp-type [Methanosarcina mazei Tuc01]|uniref:Thiol peroxidase, Bcp-type n=1 Tax=Methanosarcina mazei Tuc01 TaxID=1236903 RepID=M1Q1X5_METMZ|nr:Thiol peroxidase, Bcp-type [Methanosarcina mazei Tuc01]